MAAELPPHIWFVRANGRSRSVPVTSEGWRAVRQFVAGAAWSGAGALVVGVGGTLISSWWFGVLGGLLFVGGMAWSGWRFIDTARRHTDYDLTYNEYVQRQSSTTAGSGNG
jgi:hypothetical protein